MFLIDDIFMPQSVAAFYFAFALLHTHINKHENSKPITVRN